MKNFNKFFILLVFLSCSFYIVSLPKLLIKIPTRSRPDRFFNVLQEYYRHLSGNVPYHIIISCDEDDSSMNNNHVISKLQSFPNLSLYFGKGSTKIEAYNADIEKHLDFDVLLVASDDAVPVCAGYDQLLVENMERAFPDFDGVINFNDGHIGNELNTFPVLGRKYYEKFGYVYYPGYISVCCDVELTMISKMLNKQLYLDTIVMEHRHPSFGFANDELYKRNEKRELLEHDKKILHARTAVNFEIPAQEIKKLCSSLHLFKECPKIQVMWSILIPTQEQHEKQFVDLYLKLLQEIQETRLCHKVEVLFLKDNGEMNIEQKKTILMQQAKGKYISFLDDNDKIGNNYIKNIFNKLSKEKNIPKMITKNPAN